MSDDDILREIAGAFNRSTDSLRPTPQERWQAYARNFQGDSKGLLVNEFVSRDCPELDRSKVIYVSVGGAEGDELEFALNAGGYGYGLLFEYVTDAAKAAEEKLDSWIKAKRCLVLYGDIANNLDIAKQWIDEKTEAIGVLISAQAVLHELPIRASPQYSFARLLWLAADAPIKILHSREPVCPRDAAWHERVILSIPGAHRECIVDAARAIQARFQSRIATAYKFGDAIYELISGAEMPGLVAIELLHKFLRFDSPDRLRHELEECLVAEDASIWAEIVNSQFKLDPPIVPEHSVTQGFRWAYKHKKIQARASDNKLLPVPNCFATLEAYNREATKVKAVIASVPAIPPVQKPVEQLDKVVRQFLETVRDQALQRVILYPPAHLKRDQLLDFCLPARVTLEADLENRATRRTFEESDESLLDSSEADLNLPRLSLEHTLARCREHVLLRGEPGEGKTTAVWAYVAECCANLVQRLYVDPGCLDHTDFVIPLALPLGDFSSKATSPSDAVLDLKKSMIDHMLKSFVSERSPAREVLKGWLEQKFERRECTLFLDAFDEALESAQIVIPMACQQLAEWRIVMTSRLSTNTRSVLVNPLRLRMICFWPRDVEAYVNRYFAGSPQRAAALATIRQRLSLSTGVRALAQIPLLLASICSLVEHDPQAEIPSARHKLLLKGICEMLRRGDIKKHRKHDPFRTEAKISLLGRLAWTFWARGPQVIKLAQLERSLSDVEHNQRELLNELIHDGVLIQGKLGHRFILRSFHEACLAYHIATNVLNQDRPEHECVAIVRGPSENWPRKRPWPGFCPFYDPSWRAVWPLLAGLTAPRRWFFTAIDAEESDVVSSQILFAAASLTEVLGNEESVWQSNDLNTRARGTIEQLIGLLTNDSLPFHYRAALINALAAFPSELSFEPLKRRFQDMSLPILARCEIASAIGELATTNAVVLLTDAAQNSNDDKLRAYAAAALGRNASDDAIQSILSQLDSNPPTLVKFACLSALRLLGESELCASHVVAMIIDGKSHSLEVRIDAIRHAALLPWPLVKSALVQVLNAPDSGRLEDDDRLRQYCLETLGTIAVPEARDLVIESINNASDQDVSTSGIQAIGEIGDAVAIAFLERQIREHTDEISISLPALIELSRLGQRKHGDTVMACLKKRILPPYWAAYALRRINALTTQNYAEVVANILESTEHAELRSAAALWFRRANPLNGGDLLATILSRQVCTPKTGFLVAMTGTALGENRCLKVLVQYLESRTDFSDLNRIAEALVAHGEAEARLYLARLAQNDDPKVRSMILGHMYELFRQTGWRLLSSGLWIGPREVES